ncbi:hypothetical protein J7E62_15035 [Variovorax paradoxus]|nr:hypothetical protein [Variovorax paradoxus]
MSIRFGGFALSASLALHMPPAKSEQAALEAVLDALAPLFEASPLAEGERRGALLVVTEDAGSATAVQFWRDALEAGPALARPGAFPWCLANAPGATVARRFGITGPNVTWLVTRLDEGGAFDAPAAWLDAHLQSAPSPDETVQAWVLAMRFGMPRAGVLGWHWLAGAEPSAGGEGDGIDTFAALRDRLARDWVGASTESIGEP